MIPEIDLPAHASALLAAVPGLRTPGTGAPEVLTRFGHSGRVVNPLPEGRAALATLIGELAEAVSSPYLHLGGDEATLSDWEGSAAVDAYRAASGLASTTDLRIDLAPSWRRRSQPWAVGRSCGRRPSRSAVWPRTPS